MKYYAITCEDFQSQRGDFKLVDVVDNIVYVSSEKELSDPFKLSGLPESVIKEQEESLARGKEEKKKAIDENKVSKIEEGVEFEGKVYQSAEYDRNMLTSTVALFSITKTVPENFVWIAKDNTQVPFTLEKLILLSKAMAEKVQLETYKARELKDKVINAKTLDELYAIVIE